MKTIIISAIALGFITFGGCKQETPKLSSQITVIRHDSTATADTSIVRAKDVDVASLDKNKDGKVFQCPMDAIVISDAPGTCPLCRMELEEVTIAVAMGHLK
jgi:hypothetical protein